MRTGNYKKLSVNTGDKFGKLTIVKEVERFVQPSGQFQRGFLCKCDCGREKKIRLSHLKHNRIVSCGCEIGEQHGESKGLIYNVWRGMLNRCRSEKYINAERYIHRGITCCTEWRSYLTFKEWALSNGWEHGLQLDREDNNKGYSPDNCRFVEPHVNCNNRECTLFVNYKGERIAFMELIRSKNLFNHADCIRQRILRGWEHNRAFDENIVKGDYLL